MTIEAGQQLLHYRLTEKIGEGGMGVVWKAIDSTLDREVAIKILPEGFATDPERLTRFEREAKLLASLNHPNIVTVYDADREGGVFFITMEMLMGESLNEVLRREGRVAERNVVQLGLQVAAGLGFAHAQGIVHRDIKTANLFLTSDKIVKIMDFGLAKILEQAAEDLDGEVKVMGMVRFLLGEGVERSESDFAAEVAAQLS